jgi:hypothetical protein
MPAALQQDASELSRSVPEDVHESSSEDYPDQSEEEVQRRLNRAREERESLARIFELNKLEAKLENKLANKRQRG